MSTVALSFERHRISPATTTTGQAEASKSNGRGAVDTTEIWEVTNRSGNPHNFHIHDVQFRVLALDGDTPPAHLVGPKDTVFIPPGSSVRVAVRFADYSDPDVPYMYHCHVLEHEDAGMMGQFTVVAHDDIDSAPQQTPNDPEHDHDR